MDVVQKVKDLSNLAYDENTSKHERLQAAIAALRLVDRFVLGKSKKKIDVATDIVNTVVGKIMNPDFMEGVASGVDKFADSVDRIFGSAKRVSDRLSQGGRKSSKRKYK
jgi:hypothetical protein